MIACTLFLPIFTVAKDEKYFRSSSIVVCEFALLIIMPRALSVFLDEESEM